MRREQTLAADDAAGADLDVADGEAGPDEELLLKEVWTELLAGLSRQESRVFQLYLEGHAVAEICVRQRCSERTVQRALQMVRAKLEAMAREE